MKTSTTILIFTLAFSFSICSAQPQPVIQWQRSLGGSSNEWVNTIIETSDGNMLVLSTTSSNDGDVSNLHGGEDIWLVKLDLEGNLIWEKTYGGSAGEFPYKLLETEDGSFVILGNTYSQDGEVTGYHGDGDGWLIKVDANGNLIWQKAFGGSLYDDPYQLIAISTGGYLVTAETLSDDGDVTGHHGNKNFNDVWVIKFDDGGNIVWQKSLGGSRNESPSSALETSDGSFIIGAHSGSDDGDVTENNGAQDAWIIKLSDQGDLVWQQTFGGSKLDVCQGVIPGDEGNYFFWGQTFSPSVPDYHNAGDFWFLKFDTAGNITWQNAYGGSEDELAYGTISTSDGGYLSGGYSRSSNGDVSGNQGIEDYWIIKTDGEGNLEWENSLGGTEYEVCTQVWQNSSGHYMVSGFTKSDDGDVIGNHGADDLWLLELDVNGNQVWQRALGGTSSESAPRHLEINSDQLLLAANSNSDDGDVSGNHGLSDVWLVMLQTPVEASIITLPIEELNLSPGDQIIVSYATTGIFNAGNIFTAKLSDATGNFSSPVTIGTLTSTTSGTINAMIPGSTPAGTGYRIRVVGSDPIVIGSDNDEDITITSLTCDIPTGAYTNPMTSNSAKIHWDAVSDAEGYKVRYKVFGTSEWTSLQSNDNDKTISGLTASTEYVWQVKSICGVNPIIGSEWSEKQFFTTNSLKLSSEKEPEFEISPNPFSYSTTISFSPDENSQTTMELFDLAGRKIKMLFDENVEAGNHQIQLNREQLSAGIYFLQLKTSSSMITKKLVIE